MRGLLNLLVKKILEKNYRKLEYALENPLEVQQKWFKSNLEAAKSTKYGKQHQFKTIRNYETFVDRLRVNEYEDLRPSIEEMMKGKPDILWRGVINWYSKSSGTTGGRSKYIPVPKENLKLCHNKGSTDVLSFLYHHNPNIDIFKRKNLIMGGSLEKYKESRQTRIGDISAVMLYHMPFLARIVFTPDIPTALLSDWEEKIEKIAHSSIKEDVSFFGGVPTWTIVLFERILELTGKTNMLEVWPNARAYAHGGVGFEPYKDRFKEFFPTEDFIYQEVYNASEGFFAAQGDFSQKGMYLLVDNGMFYEFAPMKPQGPDLENTVPLEGVKTGVNYSIIINSNGGLWRYMPGDVVSFSSTLPYIIHVSGRTRQYINAFGEELMIGNTDKALANSASKFGLEIVDYTVAPIYLEKGKKGAHQWLVEFANPPAQVNDFKKYLDQELRKLNSDYDAKRSHDLALEELKLEVVPSGTFLKWLESKGKMGGQNKVPRLSNDRKHIEEIINFIGTNLVK
jgi:post-segregation antitoxin (ccd killing protein)